MAVALATPAWAQNDESAAIESPEDARSADDQEIVITAERRVQSLQDVPIAATVLTATDLADRGVDDVRDLQQVAPSVAINTFNRSVFINIRGVGIALSAPTSNPGIAYYVDGVLIPHEQFIGQSFFDIGQIEVLRGPQGTLTGQNSTGGAIYVRTPEPEFGEVSGYGEVTFGDYGVIRTIGALNVGFNDNIALRVAAIHDERDSFSENLGPTTRTPGNVNLDALRLNLAIRTPNGRFRFNVRAEIFDYQTDNNAVKRRDDIVSTDPFVIQEDADSFLNQRGHRFSLEARYDITDEIQARALASWQDGYTYDQTDRDRTATALPRPTGQGGVSRARTEFNTRIQEINLLSTGSGPFQWVVGAFRMEETIPFINFRDQNNTRFFVAPTAGQQGTISNGSESLFAQVNWFVIPSLELIVGGRYSWDEQIFNRAIALPPTFTIDSAESDKLTGRLGVNFHASDDVTLYATLSRGYKAGGVNLAPGDPPFGPETNNVFELGAKTRLLDRRLNLNAALFRSRYRDIQFTSLRNGLPLLQNAAGGDNWGAELELLGRFGPLSFNAGIGYLDAQFSQDVCLNNTNNPAGTRTLCPVGASATAADELVPEGRVLPYSPKWTINAGIQYAIPIGGNMTLTPRLQWAHLASQLATPFPSTRTIIPARDVVDARLTLEINDRYRLEGFVTNLFDETYIASQIQDSSSAFGGYIYGAPRQIGVRGTVNF
jgi:iron complex outermembrane receptor protein